MAKPFYEFEEYCADHVRELAYDTAHDLQNEWNENLTLSQADITLITKIAQKSSMAILRAYHNWNAENQL